MQQICGLSGSESDNIRRAIGRKQKDRLDKAMPSILEGYCNTSSKSREESEQEAREFLQIIEDSASYQFGYNHSIAYCLLGYLCAYFRHYFPIEFITSFLNNAANDDDISNGSKYANKVGIKITMPKWGISKGEYFYDKHKKTIAKGLSSVKHMGNKVANELYELSKTKEYKNFVDLLSDIKRCTSVQTNQLEILIKIDFFSEFGNQRELLAIYEMFNFFKYGASKQIKKSLINGTMYEETVRKYSTGRTKTGAEGANYVINDIHSILVEMEEKILSLKVDDLSLIIRAQNFNDVMGYAGYQTGEEKDRTTLYIRDVFELRRRKDDKLFGYNILTQSLGSGKESSMTVFKTLYEKDPIKKGDFIKCLAWERDGKYYRLRRYEHMYA